MGFLNRLNANVMAKTKQIRQTKAVLEESENERIKLVKEFDEKLSKLLKANDYEGIKALVKEHQQKMDAINERISNLGF